MRPDGALRIAWQTYRLDDRGGFVRLFTPPLTPRFHESGTWSPDGPSIALIDPSRPYVVHWWNQDRASGFYVDAARSIDITDREVTYVDLFLDLSFRDGQWELLDEDELPLASVTDAAAATAAIAEVRKLIETQDRIFDVHDALWEIPADAIRLAPSTPTD
jgi:hypothetical protein